MAKLTKGDIVKLKSGGPDMAVQSLFDSKNGEIYMCQWFAGKKLESGRFPVESLDKVMAEKK